MNSNMKVAALKTWNDVGKFSFSLGPSKYRINYQQSVHMLVVVTCCNCRYFIMLDYFLDV